MTQISEPDLLRMIDDLAATPDTQKYQDLSTIHMAPIEVADMLQEDPFGSLYRKMATDLYLRIARRDIYSAAEDEKSGLGSVPDIWRGSSPFAFRSSNFVGEFLAAWSAIFTALDVKEGDSVLEYGPGSGQALLMLARTGIRAFGADIDEESLALVKRQSEAMGLDVRLERAAFGEGFAGERFDRILFFEAFHHALDFETLLLRLHDQLNANGKLVLSGEPVVDGPHGSVPYPWGPRLDALSVFCIRRNGWMELGFQRDFFVRLLMRCGWLVDFKPGPVFRAWTYICSPIGKETNVGDPLLLPVDGWGSAEGSHRWTVGTRASLPLPGLRYPLMKVALEVTNYLPQQKTVEIQAGSRTQTAIVRSGTTHRFEFESLRDAMELTICTDLTNIPGEPRQLGIAVRNLVISPIAD